MAKEKFLIIVERMMDNCFGAFSESENRANLDAGTADPSDPYSWIEATFEFKLVRHREATHLCSVTPSAYYIWLENVFVGQPNAAWDRDGDPLGLVHESGGDRHGYGTYRDDYDPRFIAETFTIDTVKDLDLRKPAERGTRRSAEAAEAYHRAIWEYAEEIAQGIMANDPWAEILNVYTWRQHEREQRDRIRQRSLDQSRAWAGHEASTILT